MPNNDNNDNKKSFLDNMFDVADSALGSLEGALVQTPSPDKPKHDAIDAEFREVWSQDVQWATALSGKLGEAHHAFKKNSGRKALCSEQFNESDLAREPQPLDHGKRIVACTTCIIEISRG